MRHAQDNGQSVKLETETLASELDVVLSGEYANQNKRRLFDLHASSPG